MTSDGCIGVLPHYLTVFEVWVETGNWLSINVNEIPYLLFVNFIYTFFHKFVPNLDALNCVSFSTF